MQKTDIETSVWYTWHCTSTLTLTATAVLVAYALKIAYALFSKHEHVKKDDLFFYANISLVFPFDSL